MTDAIELAAQAAVLWGGGRLTPVAIRENAVFRLERPAGTLALRLHREGYQSRAAIAAELHWTAALSARGFPAPAPVATQDGRLVAEVGGRAFSALVWLEGRPVGQAHLPLAGTEAEQGALFHAVGALVGRLHSVTDELALPPDLARPRWDRDGLLGDQPLWGPFWTHPGLDDAGKALIGRARAEAWDRLSDGALDVGLIHADVMRENVLRTETGLSLIDFDDSGYGFRGYDLGTAVVQSLEEPHLPALTEALLAGYKAAHPASRIGPRELVLFTLLRCLASSGWIMTRAASNDPRQEIYLRRALRLAKLYVGGRLF